MIEGHVRVGDRFVARWKGKEYGATVTQDVAYNILVQVDGIEGQWTRSKAASLVTGVKAIDGIHFWKWAGHSEP